MLRTYPLPTYLPTRTFSYPQAEYQIVCQTPIETEFLLQTRIPFKVVFLLYFKLSQTSIRRARNFRVVSERQNVLQPRSHVLYVPIQLQSEIMQKITRNTQTAKLLIFLFKLGARSQKSPQIHVH